MIVVIVVVVAVSVAAYVLAGVLIAAWWLVLSFFAARAKLYPLDRGFWGTILWRSATWPWWRR